MVAASQQHPTLQVLAAFGQGRLSDDEMSSVEEHVSQCAACCRRLGEIPDDRLAELAREAHRVGAETVAVDSSIADDPADLQDRQSDSIPDELVDHPRYRVLQVIGKGGMGVVYKAEHRIMQRVVALKLINRRFISKPEAIERFRQEVRAAAQLSHPNIVAAFDAEQAGDLHFLVMEFVEGKSLAQYVQKRGPFTIVQACNAIRQVCQGLHHAHERGMIHRDIKPQNLMVTRSGRIKILDFGLARLGREQLVASPDVLTDAELTTFGTLLGTPDYMAPEQATDARSADKRADIFSLGCTLYFLLTGRPPFEAGSFTQMLHSGVERTVIPLQSLRLDVPAELVAIIDKLMATDPRRRFQSVSEVQEALTPFARSGDNSNVESPSQVELQSDAPSGDDRDIDLDALPALVNSDVADGNATTGRTSRPRRTRLASESTELDDPQEETLVVPRRGRGRRPGSGRGSRRQKSKRLKLFIASASCLALALILFFGRGNERISSSGESVRSAAAGSLDPGSVDTGSSISRTGQPERNSAPKRLGSKHVLFVLPGGGFWWDDYEPVRHALETEGIRVTVGSNRKVAERDQRGGGEDVKADVLLKDVRTDDFDAVIFCGGQGIFSLVDNNLSAPDAHRIVHEMLENQRIVSALCMGPAVLASAGVLRDYQATGYPLMRDKFQERWKVAFSDAPVVRSGQIITGRDPAAAVSFAKELIAALTDG